MSLGPAQDEISISRSVVRAQDARYVPKIAGHQHAPMTMLPAIPGRMGSQRLDVGTPWRARIFWLSQTLHTTPTRYKPPLIIFTPAGPSGVNLIESNSIAPNPMTRETIAIGAY